MDPTMPATEQRAPQVRIETVSGESQNSVIVSATVIAQGDSDIVQHGHCWSTKPNASSSDMICNDHGRFAFTGSYVSQIEGLETATRYYVRAYAINLYGTTLSDELSFQTREPTPNRIENCVDISVNQINFGNVVISHREEQRVVFTNRCDTPVRLTRFNITPSSPDGFMIRSETGAPIYLEQGEMEPIDIIFIAASTGLRQSYLTIDMESISGHGSVYASWSPSLLLSANVIANGPSIRTQFAVLDFGSVARGSSSTEEVRISNAGTQTLVISSLRFSNSDNGDFSLLGPFRIPARIEPGQTATFIQIRFQPKTQTTQAEGTLLLVSNDQVNPQISIPVRGTAQ